MSMAGLLTSKSGENIYSYTKEPDQSDCSYTDGEQPANPFLQVNELQMRAGELFDGTDEFVSLRIQREGAKWRGMVETSKKLISSSFNLVFTTSQIHDILDEVNKSEDLAHRLIEIQKNIDVFVSRQIDVIKAVVKLCDRKGESEVAGHLADLFESEIV